MICHQTKTKKSFNEINPQSMKQSSKSSFQQKEKSEIKRKPKESTGCLCFSFSKKNYTSPNKMQEERLEPDESIKMQAMKMSRQIAIKSFKHLTRLKSNYNVQKDSDNSSVKKSQQEEKQKNEKFTLKVKSKDSVQKQKKKEQFNMNRLTFSAVNKSYQKTVNTTINTSMNQSTSMDTSNILGSLISLKRQKEKKQDQRFDNPSHKASLHKSNPSIRSQNTKNIKILKTTPQFQPIKQENEESQIKKYKIIKIKRKEPSPQIPKKIDFGQSSDIRPQKIETQQEILPKQVSNEQIQNLRYEYSSIIIDYFNPSPEILEQIKLENENDKFQQNQQRILPTQQQKIVENNQLNESSMSYSNSISISNSNVRLINNVPSSVSSSQSNLLSFSINQNNINDFSCSFESIARKDAKVYERNENILFGIGLSRINQNQESEIYRNESEVSQYHPEDVQIQGSIDQINQLG